MLFFSKVLDVFFFSFFLSMSHSRVSWAVFYTFRCCGGAKVLIDIRSSVTLPPAAAFKNHRKTRRLSRKGPTNPVIFQGWGEK